ncbi:MAG: FAD-dependent oxidoreductase, partial [Armatimonadota bacterium]
MKVAVIGAGISGLATAMHLERAGVDVTIYEA